MSEIEKKMIRLRNETKLMSLDEVYKQFNRYAYSLTKKYSNTKIEFDDIYQIANVGLIKAYNSYNADKNILFMTYCSTCMNNEILMAIRKSNKVNEIKTSLDDVICDNGEGGSLHVRDIIASDVNIEEEVIKKHSLSELDIALDCRMQKRNSQILKDYYYNNMDQKQIAEKFKISQSYVSRVLKNGLVELKLYLNKGDNCMEGKITREQLIEEVKTHGNNKKAVELIASKYGLTIGTTKFYISSWKINDEINKSNSETPVEDSTLVKPKTRSRKETKNEINIEKSSDRILQPLLLRGELMEYRIQENGFYIKNHNGTTELVLKVTEIDNFIKELNALKNVV